MHEGGGTGGGYDLIVAFSFFLLLSFVLSSPHVLCLFFQVTRA